MNTNLAKELIKWSKKSFPDLPWRKSRSLYTTLVSEIMLQQTTVSTVKPRFAKFIEKFETLRCLSSASEEEVLRAWEGLGYYSRARRLHSAAKFISQRDSFPQTYDELIQIKGIGEYTANSLLAIGMNKKALAIDANIERVLSRFYGILDFKGECAKKIKSKFEKKQILNLDISFRDLNEALMDIGRVYCKARRADCLLCPLNESCLSFQNKKFLSTPMKKEKKQKAKIDLEILRVVLNANNKYLFFKRPKDKWLSSQLELPSFIINKNLHQYPILRSNLRIKKLPVIKSSITKYKISNKVFKTNNPSFLKIDASKAVWLKKSEFKDYHLSSITKKVLASL